MSPPNERSGPIGPLPENVDTPADSREANTDGRQICEHALNPLMFRSELGHFDGLVCGICAERHIEDEVQEDWGLCSACGLHPADRHWPESARPEMVDGLIVYVQVICVYLCAECGI